MEANVPLRHGIARHGSSSHVLCARPNGAVCASRASFALEKSELATRNRPPQRRSTARTASAQSALDGNRGGYWKKRWMGAMRREVAFCSLMCAAWEAKRSKGLEWNTEKRTRPLTKAETRQVVFKIESAHSLMVFTHAVRLWLMHIVPNLANHASLGTVPKRYVALPTQSSSAPKSSASRQQLSTLKAHVTSRTGLMRRSLALPQNAPEIAWMRALAAVRKASRDDLEEMRRPSASASRVQPNSGGGMGRASQHLCRGIA
eukprot:2821113-Pleurochrysis_carterae.AAC.13